MQLKNLIKTLSAIEQKHGDLWVFFSDPNTHQGPFEVVDANIEVTKPGDYPKDWNMPKKFVHLVN